MSDKKEKPNLSVQDIFNYVCDQMCDKYCRFPEKVARERKDEDDADDYLYEHYCEECPMNLLI